MGDVVYMEAVKPKIEARSYNGHRFTLSFRPHKPIGERWEWHVKFTRVYEFAGNSATIENAARDAKRKIDSMIEKGARVG